MLCYIVSYCVIVLCCVMLCYIVLCCITLCYSLLYCVIVLCCSVMLCYIVRILCISAIRILSVVQRRELPCLGGILAQMFGITNQRLTGRTGITNQRLTGRTGITNQRLTGRTGITNQRLTRLAAGRTPPLCFSKHVPGPTSETADAGNFLKPECAA